MIRVFVWLCRQLGPFVLSPELVEGSKHERAVGTCRGTKKLAHPKNAYLW